MSGRWARCGSGSGSASSDIAALRAGLHRAENPQGVLRGSVRPEPPDRVAALLAAQGTASDAFSVFGDSSRGRGDGTTTGPIIDRTNSSRSGCVAAAPVSITGMQISMSVASRRPSVPVQPRPQPLDGNEKALELRRKHKVIRFVGGSSDGIELPDAEWVCAICLSNRWARVQLARMPRCEHCFHSSCVDKWFLRSGKCPSCRQPV